MSESIYAYVLDQLQQTKGKWAIVAEGTGVPLRSIEKIARLEWKNPGVQSIETLANWFRRRESRARAKSH